MKRLALILPLLALAVAGCFRVEVQNVAVIPPDALTNAPAASAASAAPAGATSADIAKRLDNLPVVSGLSFYLVAEDSDARAKALVSAPDGTAPDGFLATPDDYGFVRDPSKAIDSAKLRAVGNPPAGQICLIERISENLYAPVFVEEKPAMRQLAVVRSCKADVDAMDRNLICVDFGKRDARAFAEVTSANAMNPGSPALPRLAIVLGDAVLCAPIIREPILDGRFVVSGSFTSDEAAILAKLIGSADPEAVAEPTPFIWDLLRPADPATQPAP